MSFRGKCIRVTTQEAFEESLSCSNFWKVLESGNPTQDPVLPFPSPRPSPLLPNMGFHFSRALGVETGWSSGVRETKMRRKGEGRAPEGGQSPQTFFLRPWERKLKYVHVRERSELREENPCKPQ